MNKTIENIQNSFEVTKINTIPDATLHYHDYIEIELLEKGEAEQIINDNSFSINSHYISILRPYIDGQSTIVNGTKICHHSFNFEPNTNYIIKYGSIYIEKGNNKGKYYLFLSVNGNIIAESIIDDIIECESIGFFAKYASNPIYISQCNDYTIDFSSATIISQDELTKTYDIGSNIDVGLPYNYILDTNDLSFYKYTKSNSNTNYSFVFSFNLNLEYIVNRILTTKLISKDNELNFLITADKVIINQISPNNNLVGYKLCITPNLLSEETRKKILSSNTPLCNHLSDEVFENMKRVFELLLFFYNQNNIPNNTTQNLVDVIFQLYFDATFNHIKSDPLREKVIMFFMDNNHFLDNITLEEFALFLGYDSGYASRICIKTTGYSFVKYKNYLRLQYAKHLVIATNISITDIAMKCGFNSQSVFNRFFNSETGYSPTQYRSLNK